MDRLFGAPHPVASLLIDGERWRCDEAGISDFARVHFRAQGRCGIPVCVELKPIRQMLGDNAGCKMTRPWMAGKFRGDLTPEPRLIPHGTIAKAPAMNLTRIIEIKEQIAASTEFKPDECDFILECLNLAVEVERARSALDPPTTELGSSGSVDQTRELLRQISPFFAGHHPAVLMAALAELAAMAFAGQSVAGNAAETKAVQDRLLIEWVKCIRRLIPVNMRTQDRAAGRGDMHDLPPSGGSIDRGAVG